MLVQTRLASAVGSVHRKFIVVFCLHGNHDEKCYVLPLLDVVGFVDDVFVLAAGSTGKGNIVRRTSEIGNLLIPSP